MKSRFAKRPEKNCAKTAWINQRSGKVDFLKFNGVLQEIVERYPNINIAMFLREELRLPDFKAEELAARIEKNYCKKITQEEQKPAVKLLEKPNKPDPTKTNVYSGESLSEREFEHFIRWLLEELSYIVLPEKYATALGFDLIATKDGERIAVLARRTPKNCKVSNLILWMAEQAKQALGCQKSIVLSTASFTQQTEEDAQRLGVELWDADTLTRKIREVRKKADSKVKARFPNYEGSLLQSLLRLEETEQFIVEPKAGGKYDLHLPQVKYPLLTFQAQSDTIVRCVYRIKNSKPVTENEGEDLISVDRSGVRHGPDDRAAYDLVMQYLEEFLE
jgi:HJR/Mrr/RecB family endonuclease